MQVNERSENRDFSKAFDAFAPLVNASGPVLDIGCGTGNHLAEFDRRKIPALGIEPSAAMRGYVLNQGFRAIDGTFETLKDLSLPKAGGIWCAASLLHVPEENLLTTFKTMFDLLLSNAPLYFTVRLGTGGKWDKWDDESGEAARFIQLFQEGQLLQSLKDSSFKIVNQWIENSTWGRPSQWISVIAKRL